MKKEQFISITNLMLTKQISLNVKTNGSKWSRGFAQNGKEINWNLCIQMEASEIIDSTPWKHWKDVNKGIDIDNIHIELVDIWHFIMSKMLEDGTSRAEICDVVYRYHKEALKNIINIEPYSTNMIVKYCNKLIAEAIKENKPLILHPQGTEYLLSFFEFCNHVGLSYQHLYDLFNAKQVLNQFRQDNGYQSSHYKKMWNINENIMEDNKVLFKILSDHNDSKDKESIEADVIYEKLEQYYDEQ